MRQLTDIFHEVFRAICANKLRSFLTMFGIAWGVGSTLLLIGLGEGFRSGQRNQMASLGEDVIMMWAGYVPAVPQQHTGMRPYVLTVSDEMAVRAQANRVRAITAILQSTTVQVQSDYASGSGTVTGVEPNYRTVRFLPMAEGRFLRVGDLEQRRRVIVLGQKAALVLFPGHPVIDEWVLLNGARFQVIGVADSIGHGNNESDNERVYIPLSTMFDLFPLATASMPHEALSSLQYQPRMKGDDVGAMAQVHQIIARRHDFDPNARDAFDEWDTIKTARMVGAIFDAMDWFLGGVGIVTLTLGAVGIANIMLVSVTERTREIGLRKALGATNRSILTHFLLEGMVLTGLSGAVGLVGASLLMLALDAILGSNNLLGFDPPKIVPWSAALALGTLSLSGIVSGLYPARHASRLDPVEALRWE